MPHLPESDRSFIAVLPPRLRQRPTSVLVARRPCLARPRRWARPPRWALSSHSAAMGATA